MTLIPRGLISRARSAWNEKRLKVAPEEEASLERLANPWRTARQLAALQGSPRSASGTFDFAILGDAEPGRFWVFRKLFSEPAIFSKHLGALHSCPLDFILQLGDMVSRGTPDNYEKLFKILSLMPPQAPYLTVIGNHDRSRPNGRSHSRLYRQFFGSKTNYFFDRGPARFVIVDTSRASLSQAQLKWLDLVLETPLRKIVFTHMPPLSLRFWKDLPISCRGGFKGGSQEFVNIMSRRHVDRVYTGHIHAFAVHDHEGVRYILTGGGGSPLFPSGIADRFYHYLTVSISPDGIKEIVHPLNGTSFPVPKGTVLLAGR
jgi:hypothetical protein